MKNKLLQVLLLTSLSTSMFAGEYDYGDKSRDNYAEFDYHEELSKQLKETLKDIKSITKDTKENYIIKRNRTINEIQDRQRVKFNVKDYKKMDIFVREDFTVIDTNYVLKNPSGWRRILIKESNIWE